MKILHVFALVVSALLLVTPARSFAVEAKNGNIRVIKVKGTPVVTSTADNSSSELKEGAFLQQGNSIKTGKDSEAILLFSNGTTITVKPETNFVVDQFLQSPFDSTKVDYNHLKAEPSVSKTKVTVSEGSIVGDVCKLNKGSTFNIGTPVGVAGIRGTIVQVTVSRPGAGPQTVTVNLPEGTVDFSALDGQTFTLTDGTTITVNVGGQSSGITPLSAQQQADILSLVQQAAALIPNDGAFEGVSDGSPEIGDGEGDDGAGGFGGDQGAGDVGGVPTGGSGGGGGGSSGGGGSATPTPTPAPPVS